jgi:hypothetical protein
MHAFALDENNSRTRRLLLLGPQEILVASDSSYDGFFGVLIILTQGVAPFIYTLL